MIAYLFIFAAILGIYCWNARDIRIMKEQQAIIDKLTGKKPEEKVIVYRVLRIDLSTGRRIFSIEIAK